jgi:DEAD/DEAH box helicase domain-containing protein
VQAITESGAPSGEKHVLLWNPPVLNPDLGLRASARSQSQPHRAHRDQGRAEDPGVRAVADDGGSADQVPQGRVRHDPRKPARIRAYRGGYLPTERREAERAMRAGDIDGIVSTSALELGVDIGSLDVVVLNGYPGIHCRDVAALRPRRSPPAGRAGGDGGQQPAAGSVRGAAPGFLRRRPPEHARIAPDQPLILFDHIRCAAFELPF